MNMLLDIVNSETFMIIQILFVVIFGSLCVIALALKAFNINIQEFIKKHIVAEFEGPDVCFECNKTTCNECPFKEEWKTHVCQVQNQNSERRENDWKSSWNEKIFNTLFHRPSWGIRVETHLENLEGYSPSPLDFFKEKNGTKI